jgi:prepilin-type N-terminal cleavage/methylation domain-containing protein
MDCKIASTTKRRSGFTLVELLIASGLSSMVMGVVATTSVDIAYALKAIESYNDYEGESQVALDRLSRDIRQSYRVDTGNATSLTLVSTNNTRIVYNYNATAQELARTEGGVTQTLLHNCSEMQFAYYQRNPVTAVYNQFPTGNPLTTKLVEVSWHCVRPQRNITTTSSDFQSAKIVIRKE